MEILRGSRRDSNEGSREGSRERERERPSTAAQNQGNPRRTRVQIRRGNSNTSMRSYDMSDDSD